MRRQLLELARAVDRPAAHFRVAIIELDDRRVQSPLGEVNRVRNLRVARDAILTHRADQETVDAVVMTPEEGGPILRGAPHVRAAHADCCLRGPVFDPMGQARYHPRRPQTDFPIGLFMRSGVAQW